MSNTLVSLWRCIQFYNNSDNNKSDNDNPNMFNLYFLACTDEKPPSHDVNVVEIREWLRERPYTTLELQHYPATNRKYNTADLNHESGFTALAFIVTAQHFEDLKVSSNVEDVGRNYPEYNSSVL